jgi:hypothetical protein
MPETIYKCIQQREKTKLFTYSGQQAAEERLEDNRQLDKLTTAGVAFLDTKEQVGTLELNLYRELVPLAQKFARGCTHREVEKILVESLQTPAILVRLLHLLIWIF